jgi:hypothetical protein
MEILGDNMKKIFALFLLASFACLGFVSAYVPYDGYYGDYPSSSHYVSESNNAGHYSYVAKDSYDGAYGKVTNYKEIDDYSFGYARPIYSGYAYRTYGNPMDNYWHNGPNAGYSYTQYRYLGYGYDDSYQRTVYGSNYHPYYYQPMYNGQYYDHSYRGCGSYYC